MFETTIAFLDTNNALWSAMPAFAAAVTDAKNGVAAIRGAAAGQESPTSGIADEKAQARDDLEDLTLEIADPVAALAEKTSNPALAQRVQLTRSGLDQAQDDDLVQISERVRDAANTNVAALAPYGITAGDITALRAAITAFSGMKTGPRTAKATRSGLTTTVASLIGTTRSLFRNQLDKLMTPFRRANPEFYAGYISARVIIDRAATRPPTTATPPPPPPPPARHP